MLSRVQTTYETTSPTKSDQPNKQSDLLPPCLDCCDDLNCKCLSAIHQQVLEQEREREQEQKQQREQELKKKQMYVLEAEKREQAFALEFAREQGQPDPQPKPELKICKWQEEADWHGSRADRLIVYAIMTSITSMTFPSALAKVVRNYCFDVTSAMVTHGFQFQNRPCMECSEIGLDRIRPKFDGKELFEMCSGCESPCTNESCYVAVTHGEKTFKTVEYYAYCAGCLEDAGLTDHDSKVCKKEDCRRCVKDAMCQLTFVDDYPHNKLMNRETFRKEYCWGHKRA